MMKPNGQNFRTVSYACKTCDENAERNSPARWVTLLKSLTNKQFERTFHHPEHNRNYNLREILLYTSGIVIIILHH
jgi:hypothetical protein